MTTKTFKKKLIRIIVDSGEFITYDNSDKDFELNDEDLVVVGKDDTETFCFSIIKI